MDPLEVWVLKIEHRHGHNTYVHRTEDGAEAALRTYVEEWWGKEMGDRPCPPDPDHMVEQYFEIVDETYSIDNTTVGD